MENKKTILDYFESSVEYPENPALNILPWNVYWYNISDTFLNGFINYVTPLKIFVLDRYSDPKEPEKLNFTDNCNTKLSFFHDDIVLLSRIGDEKQGMYMFFYFDMDVSDCCIGRFKTTDIEADIFEALLNWLEEEKNDSADVKGYHELPTSFINGWVSF